MLKELIPISLSGKKILSLLAVLIIVSSSIFAQGVPQGMSYQAVVRDASGEIIPDTQVELRMSIKAGNTTIYQELHAIATNSFGLVNANVGIGQVLLGGFATIDWAASFHFLFVEVSVNGGPFMNMGISRLLSVPYAFVAQKAVEGDADADPANELQTLSQSGTDVTLSNGGGMISVADDDNDPANELQALSLNGNILELSNANSVVLPVLSVPIGTIVPFVGEIAPAGWLPCDGTSREINEYPALHGVINTLWGDGTGLNSFSLPDLRGQFLRGRDDESNNDPDASARKDIDGVTVGDKVGSYQEDRFRNHTHTYNRKGSYINRGSSGGQAAVWYQDSTGPTGGASNNPGSETRPQNASVLYIIKY